MLRLARSGAQVHALDPAQRAVDGDDGEPCASLAALRDCTEVVVALLEDPVRAQALFASDARGAADATGSVVLDIGLMPPGLAYQLQWPRGVRVYEGALGHQLDGAGIVPALYIDADALAEPAIAWVARTLADRVVPIAGRGRAKAIAAVEGLLMGVNAAIVREAATLGAAAGIPFATLMPLILKGSGATAMMPLEAESWTAETAHSCDPESLREGVVRAFDAARRVSHPLLFGTIAMGVLAHRAAESQPARGWREPTPRHRASAA